ncbi:lysophospholipase L1-like esterase [Paenibacillus rhizosphaerae]|uniref:Lysophospholipase L1-like esterase n=1 Tax=Paenibacillus rhizosphaerae TaxID=297318 RepID=A0A839TJF0_9BACL|nr:SGNH/GDSL hydrolase family protein [Paenibacillus rhizosphaerae]MBB3126801.1 lysophospholipase L1-like esterase [Paenibacillus rhizosphaerae]
MNLWWNERTNQPVKPVILFLGDSITASGHYIRYTEAWLRQHRPTMDMKLVPCGVPSETVSGLSEAAHPFPRPCIHNRLQNALETASPGIVAACYGMNDGIYHPYSEDRLAAYQEGTYRLVERSREVGAKVVLMTPPPFDPISMNAELLPENAPDFSYLTPFLEYDRVLEQYSAWLLSAGDVADQIIDFRSSLLAHTKEQRALDPAYSAGDGIHPNRAGHWVMARTLLKELFGAEPGVIPEVDAISRSLAEETD